MINNQIHIEAIDKERKEPKKKNKFIIQDNSKKTTKKLKDKKNKP